MQNGDLDLASRIHREAFSRQKESYQWLKCNLNAFPRFLSFVAQIDNTLAGYIIWAQKSGFRKDVVLELEQIAISKNGVGSKLIQESLPLVREQLDKMGSSLKTFCGDHQSG